MCPTAPGLARERKKRVQARPFGRPSLWTSQLGEASDGPCDQGHGSFIERWLRSLERFLVSSGVASSAKGCRTVAAGTAGIQGNRPGAWFGGQFFCHIGPDRHPANCANPAG